MAMAQGPRRAPKPNRDPKLHRPIVQAALLKATAAVVADDADLGEIILRRRCFVDPEELWVTHDLVIRDHRIVMGAEDIAILRAMLFSYDESSMPRPGDPLVFAVKLDDQILTEVTPRMIRMWKEEARG